MPDTTPLTIQGKPSPIRVIGGVIYFLFLLLLFFVSIELMGTTFEMFGGRGLADQLLSFASNPVSGLLIGFLATSLVQSSSTTMVVIMVGAGTIDIGLAVPIIMGANIGTTTTNTIVSLGHVTRPAEFERAFAASTVHDFFNVLAAFTLLPLEVYLHPIERTAVRLQGMFADAAGGVGWDSPLKALRDPPADFIAGMVTNPLVLLILALVLLLLALRGLLVLMRGAVLERVSGLFDRVLFRNDAASFTLGVVATATVQSSSATTSLIVPLAGTGVLSLRQIFPYTIGANIGTTITAILASLGTGSAAAMIVALAHLTFNVFAVLVFYPLKALPIGLATRWGAFAARSKASTATVLSVYIALHVIPLAFIFLARG